MQTEIGEVNGHVIVVMAPTGSGKGTIVDHALKTFPTLKQTISCTSRPIRPGEINGRHYYFVTREEFDEKIAADEFLEWAEFAGNKYGTLKTEILPRLLDKTVVIVEIELQGVEQLLRLLPREHMTIVYIEAGGWEVLQARAEARASMSKEDLVARHERYEIERQAKPLADIIIDNSAAVENACVQFEQVVRAAYEKI